MFFPVSRNQQRMVCKSGYCSTFYYLCYRVSHASARFFVDYVKNFHQRLTCRITRQPSGKGLCHVVYETDFSIGVRHDDRIADAG